MFISISMVNLSKSLVVQEGLASEFLLSEFQLLDYRAQCQLSVFHQSADGMALQTNCLFGVLHHLQTPSSPHSPPLSKVSMGGFQNLALSFQMPWCFSRGLCHLAQVNCLLYCAYCQHTPCVLASAPSRALWNCHQAFGITSGPVTGLNVILNALQLWVKFRLAFNLSCCQGNSGGLRCYEPNNVFLFTTQIV